MSIKSKLKRFEQHMNLPKDKQEKFIESNTMKNEQENVNELWNKLQTTAYQFDSKVCYIREKKIPYSVSHGKRTFDEMKALIDRWETSDMTHPLSKKGVPITKLLFFDTETTGLSSGAGTQMFLLGYASFTNEGVLLRQYLLSGPDAEPALYHFFLNDVKRLDHLVSFNGKAFDWPRLKTRHTYLRDAVPALPKFGHFDLLHGSRRLWKDTLPSCNLGTIENEKLAIHRTEDTPSYLVPMLYFDFVREGDPIFMESVFLHHEIDVLSLIALYAELTELILDGDFKATEKERFELARWYESAGELNQAYQVFAKLGETEGDWRQPARFKMAVLLKKERSYNQAAMYFIDCLKYDFNVCESATELAIIYEHYEKAHEKALIYAHRALSAAASEKQRKETLKRINRLERRARGNKSFPGEAHEST